VIVSASVNSGMIGVMAASMCCSDPMLQEPEVERREYQDDSDMFYTPYMFYARTVGLGPHRHRTTGPGWLRARRGHVGGW
jgi:hypothetical protein